MHFLGFNFNLNLIFHPSIFLSSCASVLLPSSRLFIVVPVIFSCHLRERLNSLSLLCPPLSHHRSFHSISTAPPSLSASFFFFLASIDKHSRVAVCFDYFFFGSRHYIPCAQPPPPPAKEGIDNRSFLLLPFSKTPLLLLLALVTEEKASLIVSFSYTNLTCRLPASFLSFLHISRRAGRTWWLSL